MKKQTTRVTPKQKKKTKTMIGQMTLIVTCIIVASFFVAGNIVLAKQYGLTSGCDGKTCQKQTQTGSPSCWRR